MSGGGTRYDLIVPDDEIFRVKRDWVELSDGKAMPIFARYSAWFTQMAAVVLTLVIEYSTGLMGHGAWSFPLCAAPLAFVVMAVLVVFTFGVSHDKPMVAVLAQLWRGYRLQISGLLPSHKPQPVTLQLRATARQERPVHQPWYRRIVRSRPTQPPAPPTQEDEGSATIARIPKPSQAVQFLGRVVRGIGSVIAGQPTVFVIVVLAAALFVFNPWEGS